MSIPKLVIAGTHSGAGKTTVTMGLLKLLSKRMNVQSFKIGPDYIDPSFHTYITGEKCRNLDSFLLEENTIKYLFNKNSKGKDVSIVEGVMGLFDGAKPDNDLGSTAHVAKILKAPVILVVDAKAMARSSAAIVKGYSEFDSDLQVQGVIFNRVSSEAHYELLKAAVEAYTDIKPFGYVKNDAAITLPSRHLGLIPSVEQEGLNERLDLLASSMERTIDVDGLLELAATPDSTQELHYLEPSITPLGRKIKVAVAFDEAFNFYYWDNLDLLRAYGASIHFFSPLRDQMLPEDVDLLYIGGGFPEVYMKELENNRSMRLSILENLERGLYCIAECGGYMYLTNEIEDLDGNKASMVGFINGKSKMTERLQRFGYANLELADSSLYGIAGRKIKVHEFHRSIVELEEEKDLLFNMNKIRNGRESKWQSGMQKYHTLCGYPHIHWYSNFEFIENLLNVI
ncbi:cobyrinate a,c-diamide synthase [Vallitalea okinawensis]|uniref:cobyrinate a,c-diamide synthase n=1 Tax=Vallitalea okinawensis TaxID=2078660 RepID=UPI000CFD7A34|nr:cobyrinate a,c-diamide synthase [Vallitalea okinawensis]